MATPLIIGTRESQLALWQANEVKNLLAQSGCNAVLAPIKSDGDIDLHTPLYAMGVQGIFTRSLDIALLHKKIDIAVHSMKDVPVQLPQGIVQAAVLPRASYLDILVPGPGYGNSNTIATSSIRRRAQWLHQYPDAVIENLRGNVNTRLQKVAASNWQGAIFAAAGLERIGLKPAASVDLHWMLPAPAQGAIMVVCRAADEKILSACSSINDAATAVAVQAERDFLSALMGGCSTPISALATVQNDRLIFKGNIVLPDGSKKASVEKIVDIKDHAAAGKAAAAQLLANGGAEILAAMNKPAV